MLTTTISEGVNQKLDRRVLQRFLNLFMGQIPLPFAILRQVVTTFRNVLLVQQFRNECTGFYFHDSP